MQQAVEHHYQFVDAVTSAPATATTVSAGVAVVVAGLPVVIQILTVLVLSAQAIAWAYKFHNWLKTQKKKR